TIRRPTLACSTPGDLAAGTRAAPALSSATAPSASSANRCRSQSFSRWARSPAAKSFLLSTNHREHAPDPLMSCRTPLFRALIVGSLLVLACGCGPSRGNKVSGRLLLDGQPLAGARVELWPRDDTTLGSHEGRSGADGAFAI